MRLDRYLANNTELSRKEVKQLIKSGHVKVDGIIAKNSAQHIKEDALIEADDEEILPIGLGYFMLNKPEGVVCANKDPNHSTVFDLIEEPHSDLHVAGRLDIDTTGLVLITNDGKWSHRVTSPKYRCVKTYRIEAEEFMTESMVKKIESGIFLEPENIRTLPAKIDLLSEDSLLLHISEGKYHQVKRMMHAVKNTVETLHRVSIGDITLDEYLAPGEYRPLTAEEIASVSDVFGI